MPISVDGVAASLFLLLTGGVWLYFARSLQQRRRCGRVLMSFDNPLFKLNTWVQLIGAGTIILIGFIRSDEPLLAWKWTQLAWILLWLSVLTVTFLIYRQPTLITDQRLYYLARTYSWNQIKTYHWLMQNNGHYCFILQVKGAWNGRIRIHVPPIDQQPLAALLHQKING